MIFSYVWKTGLVSEVSSNWVGNFIQIKIALIKNYACVSQVNKNGGRKKYSY